MGGYAWDAVQSVGDGFSATITAGVYAFENAFSNGNIIPIVGSDGTTITINHNYSQPMDSVITIKYPDGRVEEKKYYQK